MATVQEEPPQTTNRPGALEDALGAVARRLRLVRWIRYASRGALAAATVSLAAVVCDHFDILPDALPLAAVISVAFALGLLAGTVATFLRPLNPMDVARLAETRLGLKERLSSALDFERTGNQTADPDAVLFRRLQQNDARAYAGRLKAAEAAPLRLPWETKALVPALLLLVLAVVLPSLPAFIPPGVLLERNIVKKEGQKLEQTARVIQKAAEAKNMPATKRAALNMQKLGRRMAQGRMDKKQAMVRMAQLTQQMQTQQKQLAQQAGQSSLGGGKSLAQAGQQLSAALQGQPAAGQNGQGASKTQGANANGSKSTGSKGGANGASHPSGLNAGHGFNVPGQNKPGDKNAQNSQGVPPGAQPAATPEMQRIAQALQQNNAQTLSEQLRQLAQKTESGQLSPAQQQQAAQDLQKLANALQGTGMPETQQHAQAAAQAMARGDKQGAAQEMRKAADAADRESQEQNDQQGMQDAQNSLQDSQGEMAGAQDPGDISSGNGQGQGQGQGKQGQKGQGQGQTGPPEYGQEGNGGGGGGRGKPDTTYHKGQKPNHKVRQAPGYGADAPHWLNPNFDPSKNPRYAKLYFGKPKTAGPSQAGPTRKTRPGENDGPVKSAVPYYNSVVTAKKTAETAMDREDIPPAYKKNVSDYFNSLQPQNTPPPPATNGLAGTAP